MDVDVEGTLVLQKRGARGPLYRAAGDVEVWAELARLPRPLLRLADVEGGALL